MAMAHAVATFVAALQTDTRRRAMFPFHDPERFNWHDVPRRRAGLPLTAMTEAERAAAPQLLHVALSAEGYRKAVDIRRLEDVLRQTAWVGWSRDPDNYAFSIFRLPERLLPLGWRVEHTRRSDLAEGYVQDIHEVGIEQRHFAWAGSLQPGHAHDYRVHGPTVLIEYDNTQNDANHMHTVWHDPRHTFGTDLLQAHDESGPHRHD
jgi:hypothetical protein